MKPQVFQLSRMSHDLLIQEGALFIADAHESSERTLFWDFLLHVKQNPPPQLFLMGDMFDLLVGSVRYGVEKYERYITLLDAIAQTCDVYYFEGNHDFNLSKLFLHVKVIAIAEQPMKCKLPDGKSCLLLHGDKYGDAIHRCYTRLIRNSNVLTVLNRIDYLSKSCISKTIESNQRRKQLCKPITDFERVIQNKHAFYPQTEIIAEGHYHQNRDFMVFETRYINFSSFACNQSYFSVQSSPETEFAQQQFRSCPTQ